MLAVGESDEVLPCCCFLLPILLITHPQFKYSTIFTKSPSWTIFLQYQQYSLPNHQPGPKYQRPSDRFNHPRQRLLSSWCFAEFLPCGGGEPLTCCVCRPIPPCCWEGGCGRGGWGGPAQLFEKMGLGTPWILNLILAISFVFCRPCFGWTNPSKDTPPPAGLVLVFCVPVFCVSVDSGIGERRHSLARGTNSGILCSSVPGSFFLCHYTPQPPFLKFLPSNIFSGKYFKTYVKPSDDLCKVRNDPKKDFTIYPKLNI